MYRSVNQSGKRNVTQLKNSALLFWATQHQTAALILFRHTHTGPSLIVWSFESTWLFHTHPVTDVCPHSHTQPRCVHTLPRSGWIHAACAPKHARLFSLARGAHYSILCQPIKIKNKSSRRTWKLVLWKACLSSLWLETSKSCLRD